LLSYNYSNDMDQFTQHYIKSSIDLVREILEAKGYKVHDENKDGFSAESKMNNINRVRFCDFNIFA